MGVEQLDLLSGMGPDINEKDAFTMLLPALLEVLSSNNINSEYLVLERKSSYSSVMLDTYLVARLCFRGQHSYFSVSTTYKSLLIEDAKTSTDKNDPGFIKIILNPASSITTYKSFLAKVLDATIDKIPKEFDCCSRYMECSNQKKCINPDQEFALGCGYKRIMKRGHIFYGVNRNI